jgi:iron(III) transport system substrate-binding protein
MKRRTFTKTAALGTAGILTSGTLMGGLPAMAQQEKFGSKELIAAAEKEGGLTYYTANFAEVEQEVIKEFNKTFPKIKVSMVRAPGGQLITRIKTEAAADKLAADVIDHSDRGLMLAMIDLFQDYTPPNAADYRPDALVSPKLWPGVTLGWAIAYNTQLVKNAPKTWMDLTKPEYKGKQIGQVVGPSGGTTWTRSMFERQVLGEDYWAKQGRSASPSILRARRFPTRWYAEKSRSRPCSTTSSTPRSSKARPPRRSSRPRACRSSPTPTAFPSRRRTPTPPSCS